MGQSWRFLSTPVAAAAPDSVATAAGAAASTAALLDLWPCQPPAICGSELMLTKAGSVRHSLGGRWSASLSLKPTNAAHHAHSFHSP